MMMRARFLSFLTGVFFLGVVAASSPVFAQQGTFNAFKDPVAAVSSSSGGVTSGPDLTAVVANVMGGQVTVGSTAYIVTLFRNNGTSPVNVTGINLYPSSSISAGVTLNKCTEAPLPAAGECAVTVAVTGLQLGAYRVEILLDHDGKTRLATASITGTVDASVSREDETIKNDIDATPEKLDFGSSAGGIPLVRSLVLRNRTSFEVDLKSISLETPAQSGFDFKPECPEKMKPGETCNVTVSWTPFTKGLSQGVMVIQHSAKSTMTQVEIQGTFQPPSVSAATIYPESVPEKGLLITDLEEVDFGSDIAGASAITVSLVNAGSTSLILKSIRLSGSDSGLSIARTGCRAGMTLNPVDACPLTVSWVPSRAGAVIDDIQVHHTGARGILVLPVRGTANQAVSRETLAVRLRGGGTTSPKRGSAFSSGEDSTPRSAPPSLSTPRTEEGEAQQVPSADGGAPSQAGAELVRQIAEDERYRDSSGDDFAVTPVLDGYTVTSHAATRAVVNGPIGSLVVHDGEEVVISGVRWMVTIIETGVILSSTDDEILLVFDKSLKPATRSTATSTSTSSGSATGSGSNNSSGSSSNSNSNNTTQ